MEFNRPSKPMGSSIGNLYSPSIKPLPNPNSCPFCRAINQPDARYCIACTKVFAAPLNGPQAVENSPPIIEIDCQACKTPASMKAAEVPRFSPIIRLIGVILLIPSFLGIAFAGLMFFSALMTMGNAPATHSDAEAAGRAIGFTMVGGFSIFIGVCSLVGGLLGWILLLNRKAFKCFRCGFLMDRDD